MGINSPFIYSYETLNDALSSALQNFTNTKTGHKIVTLLSIPISFYIKDEFSFNQSTTEALEPNSTVKTVSVIGKTIEKEVQKLPSNEPDTWLFVLNGQDTEKDTENVHMPFIKSIDNKYESERNIFILRKAFYKVPEFMKHINSNTTDLDNSSFVDENPNVIDLMANMINIYDNVSSVKKLLSNRSQSDILAPINDPDNQSPETCTSLQHNYLKATQTDSEMLDNDKVSPNVIERLGLSKEPVHKFILRKLRVTEQTLEQSENSDHQFKKVGSVTFNKGVEVDIDKEILMEESEIPNHYSIKTLSEGGIIESLNRDCGVFPSGHQCTCKNLQPHYLDGDHLPKIEVWMVVSLTMACLGIIICISFFMWISCCKVTKCISFNILDGSQTLTLILLICITLLFCSVLPFIASHASPVVCAIRTHCVPMAYVAVFSAILSRSGTI